MSRRGPKRRFVPTETEKEAVNTKITQREIIRMDPSQPEVVRRIDMVPVDVEGGTQEFSEEVTEMDPPEIDSENDDNNGTTSNNETTTVKNTIFTAVSPKLIRPNSDYAVFVYVESGELASPTTFSASIGLHDFERKQQVMPRDPTATASSSSSAEAKVANEPLFSSQQIQVAPGSSGLLLIPVKNLPDETNSFKLTLRGFHLKDETKLEETTTIFKDTKIRSLLLQTDKPIYKPGETVQFRAVMLNRFLRPLHNDQGLNITILDPQQNIIKQWTKAELNNKGLFSSKLELSSEPNLGDWVIRIKDFTGETSTMTFSVDQNVLPKFKVDVNLPTFLTYNNSKFIAEVKAAYTYGKPINSGSVEVKLSEYYQYRYHGQQVKSVLRKSPITENGTVFIEFDIVKDLLNTKEERSNNRYDREFIIEATVTDGLTGRIQNGSSRIKIYENEFKVELIQAPPNYKPGFPMSLLLKITKQDGTPVADLDEKAVKIAHGYTFNEDDAILYFPLPANGIIKLTLPMPTNQLMCSSAIEVTYKGVTHSLYPPQKLNSPSRTYMELTILTEKPTIGSLLDVHVKLNKPFDGLNYIVYGRGEVLTSSHVETNGEVKDLNFTIPIVNGAAPEATVLVYTIIKPNNEVAVDSKRFNIDTVLDNHLTLSLSKTTAEPGETISLNMDTESGSLVALRGIDQSVTLLKEDKDITMETIEGEIKSFQNQLSGYRIWGGSNAFQLFEEAGVVILTNGLMEKEVWHRPIYRSMMARSKNINFEAAAAPMALAAFDDGAAGMSNSLGAGPSQEIRVRTKFPETWLWEEVEVNNTKTAISKVVPDTLTSWLITGFSLNTDTGIGVTLTPTVLETFRPFFLTLNVPYSIVKGETFGLQVLVHNYMKNAVTAEISLSNANHEFILNDETDQNAAIAKKQVQLEPVSVQLVTFTITPTKFGIMKLDVKGVSAMAGDALSQPMIVKPQGQKHVQSRAALLDLRSAKSASYQLEAEFPPKRVEGADGMKLTVVADLLGSTISNLDKLIQLPSGCGEQNMLNFVPDVVILDYLKTVGSLTPEIRAKAIRFLETGYQRQMTYKHGDGSYSAFGKSDAHGSTWLTAFVIRSFISARPWITIDDNVLVQGLRFLAQKQHEDGSFIELGRVLHSDMQGGSGGTLALSSYVLMAFIEARNLSLAIPAPSIIAPQHSGRAPPPPVIQEAAKLNFDEVISRGINYIVKSFDVTKEDPYSMNLITYALTVTGKPEKDTFLKQLEELATKEAELVHWKPSIKNITEEEEEAKKKSGSSLYWHRPASTKPISVEMSSYGLMTYLLRNDLEKALSVGKWLLQQRNAEGGFISTQDTVVGLTALAKFAMATRSPINNLKINAKYDGGSESFDVNNVNAILLQEAFLPETVRKVNLDVNGEGTALATLTWTYYVEDKLEEPAFTISNTVSSPKAETIELLISTSFLRPVKSSNMAVMEVNLPSGYVFDTDELPGLLKLPKVMRYEQEDGGTKLQIYFDSLNSEPSTVKLTANRLFKVKNPAKAYITVYDYYDTTLKATEFYAPPETVEKDCVKNNEVCA